jgi:Transposase DDE domain
MQQRNGIEGSISELVRGHGLRRARYKGFAKVDLQNQLVAAACNIKRWLQKRLKAAFCEGSEGAFSGLKALLGLRRVAPGIWSALGAKLPRFDFGSRSFPLSAVLL